MKNRRAMLMSAAWVAGWALIAAAITGALASIWPGLPLWIVPAGILGGLMVHEAVEARRLKRKEESRDEQPSELS